MVPALSSLSGVVPIRQPTAAVAGWFPVWILVGVMALSVAGCGYHLRGSMPAGPATAGGMVRAIHLSGDRSSPLFGTLQQLLAEAGTPPVPREQAALELRVLGEQTERQVLSVGDTARVQEYRLNYDARFDVRDRTGRLLLPPQTLHRERDIRFDETAVNALVAESEQLFQDMRRAVAREILRRLAALQDEGTPNTEPESRKGTGSGTQREAP